MIRFALVLVAVFLIVGVLKVLRLFLVGTKPGAPPGPREAEMIRDPVCGTWIDRRLAVFGRRGEEVVPVCSDSCRRRLEAG